MFCWEKLLNMKKVWYFLEGVYNQQRISLFKVCIAKIIDLHWWKLLWQPLF